MTRHHGRLARFAVLSALFLLPFLLPVQAAVYVKPDAAGTGSGDSWANAFTNLQEALLTHSVAEIWVAAGVYKPGASTTDFFDLRDNDVYGGFTGDGDDELGDADPTNNVTVLDGDGIAKNVVKKSASGTAVLNGFTIRDSSGGTHGGGINVTAGDITVGRCTFSRNTASTSGGAVYLAGATVSATFTNCVFDGNTNTRYDGGAILANADIAGLAILNSTFADNRSNSDGGDIYVFGVDENITIRDCLFTNSQSTATAASLYLAATKTNILENLTFANASTTGAGSYGGVVYLNSAQTDTEYVIRNCSITDASTQTSADGAGLYIDDGTVYIENCHFTRINADQTANSGVRGGAIYIGTSAADNPVTITNCTFDNVHAGSADAGGAIYTLARTANMTITDCTFTNVSAGTGGGGAIFMLGNRTNTFHNLTFDDISTAGGTCGGVICNRSADPLSGHSFRNCQFRNVSAPVTGSGGAIDLDDGWVYMENCHFTRINADQTAHSGLLGGALAMGTSVADVPVTITNCTFNNVHAGSADLGGAISSLGRPANMIVVDCTFTNVSAGTAGGVVNFATATGADMAFSNCVFADVQTGTDGGAIYVAGGTANLAVQNCVFTNVMAGTSGGAIYSGADRTNIFSDLTFHSVSNTTAVAGKGGAIAQDSTDVSSVHTVQNCTFSDIRNTGSAGGTVYMDEGTITVRNCTFRGNVSTHTATDGGALKILSNSTGPILITNCTFDAVNAGSGGGADGGAIYIYTKLDDVTIAGCTFTNIHAGTEGGAIYCAANGADKSITLDSCRFNDISTAVNTTLSGEGGAVMIGATLASVSTTVRNCTFADVTHTGSGGGGALYIDDGAVTITDCAFSHVSSTHSENHGGAVCIEGIAEGPVLISNCTVTATSAGSGAGGLGGGVFIAAKPDTVEIADCVFSNTVGGSHGGAVYIGNSAQGSRMAGCNFADNVVSDTGYGGAVYLYNGWMDFIGCTFRGGVAQAGGAVYQRAGTTDITNAFHGCTFLDNRADDGYGGALYLLAHLDMKNCLFANNRQDGGPLGGGGIYWAANKCTGVVANCTFYGNIARTEGGAIDLETGTMFVSDSIFRQNATTIGARYSSDDIHVDAADELTVSYSDIDTSKIWAEGTLNVGEGIIDADPLFADPDGGDCHLQSPFGRWNGSQWDYTDTVLSPCIDVGDPISAFSLEPEPNGGRINMGAYGNSGQASKSGYAGLIVINQSPTGISTAQATLRGELKSKDATPTATYICWGTADAEEAFDSWQHRQLVDADAPVDLFTAMASPLTVDTVYYYRAYATNAAGVAWTHAGDSFITGGLTVSASDSSGDEEGPDPIAFTVTRPGGTTNEDIVVAYSVGGTAVNGSDYATLPGQVTIPAGQVSAVIDVAVIDDTLVESAGDTLILTLLPGAYAIGAQSSAQATIADNDSLDGFAHRMQITFSRYTRSETLADFPALVRLNEDVSFFRYSQLAFPDGKDLRFANSNETQALSYEIEEWNPAGDSFVWVRVPEMKRNATIWVLWGNAGVTQPSYTTNGTTWSAGHEAVWHLDEEVDNGLTNENAHADSTANGYDGTQTGNDDALAKVGFGQEVIDGDSILFPGLVWAPETFSASFWIRPNSRLNYNQEIGGVTGWDGFNFHTAANGTVYMGIDTGVNRLQTAADTLTLGEWQMYTFTFDRGGGRLYRNGTLLLEGVDMVNPDSWDGFHFSTSVDALVDETQISSVQRSSNWVWACWANQDAPTSFSPLGLGWPLPAVDTGRGAINRTHNSAILDGNLLSTGAAPTSVWIHYGKTDGGTTPGSWQASAALGEQSAGSLTTTVGGLEEYSTYHYRIRAVNTHGTVWSDATETFRTKIDLGKIAGTNYLGSNMDFETPGLMWYFDPHSYETLGSDGIIEPLSGTYMLKANGTGGGVNADIYGWINMDRYVDAITNANVGFSFTVHYNRIAELLPAAPIIDTMAFANVTFYDANTNVITWYGWDPTIGNAFLSDDDPLTWEGDTYTNLVPPSATQLRIRLSWSENVSDEGANEFLGHYYDDTRFALIVPNYTREPATGMMLLVK